MPTRSCDTIRSVEFMFTNMAALRVDSQFALLPFRGAFINGIYTKCMIHLVRFDFRVYSMFIWLSDDTKRSGGPKELWSVI